MRCPAAKREDEGGSHDGATVALLIVDDTVTYRKIVTDVLVGMPGVEVVGAAANGKIALQRLDQQAVDLLVLDLEMPEMNGHAVLEELRRRKSRTGAIMLSAFTAQGAKATLTALESGAFDFVLKPSGGNMAANIEQLRRELGLKLAAFARCRNVKEILGNGQAARSNGNGSTAAVSLPPRLRRRSRARRRWSPWESPPAAPRPWSRWCRNCRPICRCRC